MERSENCYIRLETLARESGVDAVTAYGWCVYLIIVACIVGNIIGLIREDVDRR